MESVVGLNYVLEYKKDLSDTNWMPILPAVPGDGGVITLHDIITVPFPHRFYRVSAYH